MTEDKARLRDALLVLTDRYPHRGTFYNESFYTKCPLCTLPLAICGPKAGKLSLLPPRDKSQNPLRQCPHRQEEIFTALNLDPTLLYDPEDPAYSQAIPEAAPFLLCENASAEEKTTHNSRRVYLFAPSLPKIGADTPDGKAPEDVWAALLAGARGLDLGEHDWGRIQGFRDYLFTDDPVGRKWFEDALHTAYKEKAWLASARARRWELKGFAQYAGGAGVEWLVEGLLVRDAPALVGGPYKSLKTSLCVDLAVSMASATPFLGRYPVPRPLRVAVFSGESGEATLYDAARRVAISKGLPEIPDGVGLCPHLPQFDKAGDLNVLTAVLREFRADVVVVDPLYLALGKEAAANASNVFAVGQVLRQAAHACLSVKATPVFVHHSTKNQRVGKVLQLGDLAFAGFAEFARQWLLVNPRRPFDPTRGLHRLVLNHGGSAGHSGVVAVDVAEGSLRADAGGRAWSPAVLELEEARRRDKGEAVGRRRNDERLTDAQKVHQAVVELESGEPGRVVGYTAVRQIANLNGGNMQAAVAALVAEGKVAEQSRNVSVGSGATRRSKGLRRVL